MNFAAPIPGMSLTKEPGNAPYEQPPLYNTPEEALAFYFEKLDDEEKLDDVLFGLANEYPVEALVDSMTSVGAMEGYHSIDVKMLISPILHEYIVNLATAAGIDFVEEMGPSKDERMAERDKKRTQLLLKKALEGGSPPSEASMDKAEDALEGEDDEEESVPIIPRRM